MVVTYQYQLMSNEYFLEHGHYLMKFLIISIIINEIKIYNYINNNTLDNDYILKITSDCLPHVFGNGFFKSEVSIKKTIARL